MKLYLENIGKIEKANVEINGITVIAGENNTGKSTIGRALFAVFNSFYDIENKIKEGRINSIDKIIENVYTGILPRSLRNYHLLSTEKLVESIEVCKGNIEKVKQVLKEFQEQLSKEPENDETVLFSEKFTDRIIDVLNIPNSDILKSVLEKNLDLEFNGQISNIYIDGKSCIKLKIQEKELDILIDNNKVVEIKNSLNLQTETVYIDDPFILDESQFSYGFNDYSYVGHRLHLITKIKPYNTNKNIIEEILVNKKMDNIYTIISSICDGEIIKGNNMLFGYRKPHTDKVLDVRNLSTGLKTFAIIKTLLMNGSIEENGTMILDEPEIHLHPEWQLIFAEIIVLLQKEFHMHILLNTHSPYFLNAIEVYSAKHCINDKCKYYMAFEEGDVSKFEDVTDNLEFIYKKLAVPLQKLETQRYED